MELTRLPSIWLMAADSLRVHSATTFALISFMYSMKALRGFFICGFLFCSLLFVLAELSDGLSLDELLLPFSNDLENTAW